MTHQTVSSFSTIGYREMSIKALKKQKKNQTQNKTKNQTKKQQPKKENHQSKTN